MLRARGWSVWRWRKTHIQAHDQQYAPGEALPVWPTPWGPVGIMICADRRWPETARTLRLKRARLILNPTYGMHHEAKTWWMRTRSYENQCFIAFAYPSTGFVTNSHGDIMDKRDDKPCVLRVRVNLRDAKDDNHLRDRRLDLYQVIIETPILDRANAVWENRRNFVGVKERKGMIMTTMIWNPVGILNTGVSVPILYPERKDVANDKNGSWE